MNWSANATASSNGPEEDSAHHTFPIRVNLPGPREDVRALHRGLSPRLWEEEGEQQRRNESHHQRQPDKTVGGQ